MKKQIPAIMLAVVSIALGLALYAAKQDNAALRQQMAAMGNPVSAEPDPVIEAQLVEPPPEIPETSPAVEAFSKVEEKEDPGKRMMSSLSQMMENPTMNKVMEASQRGAVGALYSDMIEYLDLDTDETKYFMDLLMFRQMKSVDLAMKMMSGNLSDEEKKALTDEVKEAGKTVKEEMEQFLNNPDDFAEWEFYEKTMGERMMLSQMDQHLAGGEGALSDEEYRDLLSVMHEEKKNYNFSSDLHDDQNSEISAQRFSKENIEKHANDIRQLNKLIVAKAQAILTPEQLAAFVESLKATTEMQIAQLEMAGQMFSGGK